MGLARGKVIKPGETLIVFDEIQDCVNAVASLKYFCEDAPEYHVISAGSLLGVVAKEGLSFPVGKVEFLTLYPMSFYEFLYAQNELLAIELMQSTFSDGVWRNFRSKLLEYHWDYHESLVCLYTY